MTQRQHIPAPGRGTGKRAPALCGRSAEYRTGDHALIRRLARAAVAGGDAGHYCARCLSAIRRARGEEETRR